MVAAVDVPLGGLCICRPPVVSVGRDNTAGFSLLSDLHIGAPHVDYGKIKEELQQARDSNYRILINGDVVDAILPKDHKRYEPSALHPRLSRRNDVATAQIEWAVEILQPYADLIDMIGTGNHEASLTKWNGIDPITEILARLRAGLPEKYKKLTTGPNRILNYGGYCGFIDVRLHRQWQGEKGDSVRRRFVIFYHHGSGGGAPVTKGMIDLHRSMWARADLVWMGHKHTRVMAHVQEVSCPENGFEPVVKNVRQIITGAYFQTYRGQTQESVLRHGRLSNYAADRFCAPSGNGGAVVNVKIARDGGDYRLVVEVTQ